MVVCEVWIVRCLAVCLLRWCALLVCISLSFMVRVRVGRWSNFICFIVLGVMIWHIRVSLCAPRMGASKVMMGVNYSSVWGCSLMLGVLARMYPIPVGCELSRKCSRLTRFFSVDSGLVTCRLV